MDKEFENYLVSNKEKFYRLAYSYMHNKEDALDVVQDAVCKGIKSYKRLENQNALKTWFYRIIVNTALDLLRSRNKVISLESIESLKEDEGRLDGYDDFDLKKALDGLSPKYKSVVILKYFEDMKLEDIAIVLNEKLSTVKTRLYTALKRLRIELAEEESDA